MVCVIQVRIDNHIHLCAALQLAERGWEWRPGLRSGSNVPCLAVAVGGNRVKNDKRSPQQQNYCNKRASSWHPSRLTDRPFIRGDEECGRGAGGSAMSGSSMLGPSLSAADQWHDRHRLYADDVYCQPSLLCVVFAGTSRRRKPRTLNCADNEEGLEEWEERKLMDV